jgi:hypothetical protein
MERFALTNIGETVSETEFRKGIIISLNEETDKAEVESGGELYSFVPLFYKCSGEETAAPDGSVKGAAGAFSAGDEVILCFVRGNPLVIGFPGGAKPCFTHRVGYRADDGWFIAPEGEIIPDEFISSEDFGKRYQIAEPLADNGGYALTTETEIVDECLSHTKHLFSLDGNILAETASYTDACKVDEWGQWFSLYRQALYAGFSLCFYEYTDVFIIDGRTWTVDRSYRLGTGTEFDEASAFHEHWEIYPRYSGERMRSINPFYGGRNSEGEFVLGSCVTGTNEEDTEFIVYLYGKSGLLKHVFPCTGGRADLGMGEAAAVGVIVQVRKGGENGVEES